MPVSPTDAKSWELVHSVLNWMGENHCCNYSEAFRQLGVAKASFYRAVKRPFVQNRLLLRFRAQDMAEMEPLDAYRLEIVSYQMRMAVGQEGSPRECTAAARFMAERRRILRDRLESAVGEQEGHSEASIILQRFKKPYFDGVPLVKARRRVTEEEVEVTPNWGPPKRHHPAAPRHASVRALLHSSRHAFLAQHEPAGHRLRPFLSDFSHIGHTRASI